LLLFKQEEPEQVTRYFVGYRKTDIGLEFTIPARTKQEARQIAEREVTELALNGYRFSGVN
jgi:hypothetical protein